MYDCLNMRCYKTVIALAVFVGSSAGAWGAVTTYSYDYVGNIIPPGSISSVLGSKVAELDAVSYGYDFSGGDWEHGLRNLNIISEVFVADQAVTIGTGVNGTQTQLQPGDYTFAYTLDYSDLWGFYPNSSVVDFQLARTITSGTISNPGDMIAFEYILAGAYNTDSAFGDGNGTPPLLAYPDGVAGTLWDIAPVINAGTIEYSWGTSPVLPGTKAMVLMFVSGDVDIWQVGWGSEDGLGKATLSERQAIGDTGEGGSVIGGGEAAGNIPLLIPVVPEPASICSLILLGNIFLLTQKRKKVDNTD